ncbi:MAG: peptidoglycan editing factor PgeF [Planifilum fulgidum]
MEPFRYREDAKIPCFSLHPWEEAFPRLVAGISARKASPDPFQYNYALHIGDDPDRVRLNRQKLAEQLGMSFSSWTCGEQVHGADIAEVTSEDRGKGRNSLETALPSVDGLLTDEEDILLTSFYADCVPLLFYSPDSNLIGLAHAGWRGTVGKIGPRMVEKMVRRGAKREGILAAIAPSIGGCCYEVDEHVAGPLSQVLSDLSGVLFSSRPGRWMLDLKAANRKLLLQAGIREENLLVSRWCTSCHEEHFFSHRRDRGRTGRMVAWIGMRKGRRA